MRILTTLALLLPLLLAGQPPASADEQPRGEWPLQPAPEVIERFDAPDSPYGVGHRGVDLLGRGGQQVRAAMAGTVTYAGMLAGRGVVVVDHGPTRTTYEPVTGSVSIGTRVVAGSPIGRLEVAGSHCFPRSCLHWGWIEGETYLDPLLLVGFGPIRLLPLWGSHWLVPAATGLGSRAGMSLLVGLAQAVGRDVGVELRGRQ